MAAPTHSRGNSAAREVTKQLVTSADLLLHYCSNTDEQCGIRKDNGEHQETSRCEVGQ